MQRTRRTLFRKSSDPHHATSYGEPISKPKHQTSLRVLFQNVKGLSHYAKGEDQEYYMTHLRDLDIDIAGLAETNTAWQHQSLRYNFNARARKAGEGLAKTSFGSPKPEIENIPPNETFQAGGSLTTCLGPWTTTIYGNEIQDQSGLGRWSGFSIRGKFNNILSIVTAYRTCAGSRNTAPLGSTFHRETEFFRNQARDKNLSKCPNISARQQFLDDILVQLRNLLDEGHAVILMLDANSTLTDDNRLREMVDNCGLLDLHRSDPAPSTYIGAAERRIDYMFGCHKVIATVTRQGTLAYHEGPQSDHRALYVDLDARQLLEHHANDNKIQPSAARMLKTGNPEVVATYHSKMKEYYQKHNMVRRIKRLHKQHRKYTDDQLCAMLEKWDRDQGRAMKHSESSLGSGRLKKHYWSPTLRNAGLLCRYWNLRIVSKTRNCDTTDTIHRLQEMVHQHDPTYNFPLQQEDLTTTDLTNHWKQAKKALKQLQADSRELRYKSYKELLEAYEYDIYNPESIRRAKIVKSTIRTEKCRAMYRQIRLSVKPPQENAGGIKSILIPSNTAPEDNNEMSTHEIYQWLSANPGGPRRWNTVIDRESVEEYLLQYNRASFRAASASPCGLGPILDELTFSTLSPAGTALLNGEVPEHWQGDNDLLHEFFKSFSSPQAVRDNPPITTTISEDDVKRGFGRWREATSTSPSGRHLGHYRAIVQDETLLLCLTKFIDLVVQRGITLSRWQHAINVMLEKDVGCPRINRLRIIHLFEADFNFFLKLLWGHRLVRRAHDFKMINTGQYGSVPGRTAVELVMLNQISNDICRTNKYNIIRFDNDASACYDRILVHLGMMAARRCGMPENAIQVHANTLERMKYKIKTAYGTSEEHYTGTPREPLFGTGQGSGASPAVWLTLVVVLMNTLDRITRERISFRSPDASDHHHRLIDAFVDDTSLAITDTLDPLTPTEMTRKMEKIAQQWERLLFYSGGALNLKKCSWTMLHWVWKNGRPCLHTRQDDDADITLVTESTGVNTRSVIQYNPPTQSTRILGVNLNPMGDFTNQIDILRKKSNQMSNRIRSSQLSSENVQTFLRTMYAPSMLYTLPAMATDEENLASVQTSMITTALQKMGASKTTPIAIRHGPIEMGGLNIIDLRTELGISNLKFLRNAIYTGSEAGKLLIISLKYSQLEAGVPFALLEKPHINLPYITPTWATSVRQFLYQHSITVNISETLRIRYSNKFDRCIMDSDTLRRYHTGQQRDINLVRLYLQVLTLSDLSTSDGTAIRECFLSGRRHAEQQIRRHWPRQSIPTNSQRRLWRNYITSTFISHGTKWRTPLGPSALHHRPQFSGSPCLVSTIPQKLGHECDSLKEYIARLPRWHTRLLSIWKQTATDLQIWRSFRSRQRITIASDGGLKSWLGTHGWKIVSRSGCTLFLGSGPVDGPFDISHSTRSELGGLTAPLLLVTSLAKFWGLQHKCRYKWLTDSKAAISKVTLITTSKTSSSRRYPDDIDYVTAIKELHQTLGGRSLHPTWIKGHQDDDTEYDKLSQDAKLNVDVDGLASDHFWSGHGTRPTQKIMHFHEYKVSIAINGVIYPTRIDEQIRYHINGSYLKDFIKRKKGWSEQMWSNIDIMAFGRHFKTLSGSKRVQHMKFVHDLQPLGVNQSRQHRSSDDELSKCPCCGIHEETQFHLVHCTDNPARVKAVLDLRKACRKSDGTRFLQVFGDILEQWLANPEQTPSLDHRLNPFLRHECFPISYIHLVNEALQEQGKIGWLNMLRGFLSIKWRQLASTYIIDATEGQDIENRNDGSNRVHRALKVMHTLTNELWTGRNGALHGAKQEQDKHRLSLIDLEITKFHSEADLVLTDDRFYCETSLRKLLNGSTANKRRWLLRVRASRKRHAELQEKQPRITKFFPQQGRSSSSLPSRNAISQPSSRNKSTQQLMSGFLRERPPNIAPISARNRTTQQLLTNFLHERASNQMETPRATSISPPPSTQEIG
jgi:hypothetical protein